MYFTQSKHPPFSLSLFLKSLCLALCMGFLSHQGLMAQAQPEVTVRFANPTFDCNSNTYCVDVQMQSDQANVALHGINFRFFYDNQIMSFHSLQNFHSSYVEKHTSGTGIFPSNPNAPLPAGTSFGFSTPGNADYANLVIELINPGSPLYMSSNPSNWTTYFQACFTLVNPNQLNLADFCPSLVLERYPNGTEGIRIGSGGVVITAVDNNQSGNTRPVVEKEEHFNWAYGPGPYPTLANGTINPNAPAGSSYGGPVPTECIKATCLPVITTRFANPSFDCNSNTYCVEVQMQSDVPNLEMEGINFRFFFDDQVLTYHGMSDFAPGYSEKISVGTGIFPVVNPGVIPIGTALGFTTPTNASYANLLVEQDVAGVVMSSTPGIWTTYFKVCFTINSPNSINLAEFCPPLVFERHPVGVSGIRTGSAGVVIIVNDHNQGGIVTNTFEKEDQFNWEYVPGPWPTMVGG